MKISRMLAIAFVLAVPHVLTGQAPPRACDIKQPLTLARVRFCVDTVNARRAQDSARAVAAGFEPLKRQVDSLSAVLAEREAVDHQIRLSIADIYGKLPHLPFNGATVDSSITFRLGTSAPTPVPPGSGNVETGDVTAAVVSVLRSLGFTTDGATITGLRMTQPAVTQSGVGLGGLASGKPATTEIQFGGDAGFRRFSNAAPDRTWPGVGTITIHNSGAFELTSPVPAGVAAPSGVIWWATGGNGIKSLAADGMSGTTWSGAYPEGTYVITRYTQGGQFNPWLPAAKDGHDWEGNFGWVYQQPEKSSFVPSGYGVKGDFLLRLGFHFDTPEYGTGKWDSFYDLNPGRGFEVRMNTDGIYGSVTPLFRVDASGASVPIDGQLRTLKSCNIGGVLVVCF